jgi:hypothetical protein
VTGRVDVRRSQVGENVTTKNVGNRKRQYTGQTLK